MPVVGLAVVARVGDELAEGHARRGDVRQWRQVGEVAARPRPDPLRQNDLWREPRREHPLQPAALAPVALRAPGDAAGRAEEAGGGQAHPGRAPYAHSGAASGPADIRVDLPRSDVVATAE